MMDYRGKGSWAKKTSKFHAGKNNHQINFEATREVESRKVQMPKLSDAKNLKSLNIGENKTKNRNNHHQSKPEGGKKYAKS